MKRILLVLALVGISTGVAAGQSPPNTLTPQEIAQGWILLWDGESLFGWEPHGGTEWKTSNGVLIGDSAQGGWLGTTTAFADFELKAELRWGAQRKPKHFTLTPRDGLVAHQADSGTYVPPEMAMFVEL